MLEATALAGASAVVPSASALAQLVPRSLALPEAGTPCTIHNVRGNTTATFSAQGSYGGQPLVLRAVRAATGRKYRSATLHMEITYGSERLVEVVHQTLPAAANGKRTVVSQGSVSYGPAVRGARAVLYNVYNGTVTGFMDRRPFTTSVHTPTIMHFSPLTPRVKGARPLAQPTVSVDPGLSAAVQALFATARRNVQSCRQTTVSGAVQTGPARRAEFLGGRELARRTAGSPAQLAQQLPGPCQDCYNGCDKEAIGCAASVACDILLFGGCAAVSLSSCGSGWYDCNTNCYKEGGPCCNKQCPQPPNIGGETVCCATEDVCCGDTCCDSSAPVCVDAENLTGGLGYCCPPGTKGCPGVGPGPWGSGSVVVANCCPETGSCCGSACCSSGQTCVNSYWSYCCPGQIFCAGSCCNGVCTHDALGNQVCCAAGNVCGNTCCSGDFKCLTAPNGSKVCCNGTLCGDECCGPGAICVNGKCGYGRPCGDTFCGIADPVCCNGVCCASNQTCVNGRCAGPKCAPGTVPCQYSPNQCCPPNTTCCAGNTCCPPGTMCCGARGCVQPGSCIQ